MATGDYLDLATHACYMAQVDPSQAADLTLAKSFVNQVYLQTCSIPEDWDFLLKEGQVTLVAGTDSYTLTSIATALAVGTVDEVLRIVNDTVGSTPLPGMAWDALESLSSSTQDGDPMGEPLAWAKFNDRIKFYPKPSSAFAMGMLIRQRPALMTVDAQFPLIPLQWSRAILSHGAAALMLRMESGGDALNQAQTLDADRQQAIIDMRGSKAGGRRPTLTLQHPGFMDDPAFSYHPQGFSW